MFLIAVLLLTSALQHATCVVYVPPSASAATVVSAIFGTNLNSQIQEYPNVFYLVCVCSATISVTLVMIFFMWTYRSGIVMF